MQHDPLVELCRQIDEHERAEEQADARCDLEALGRHSEALRALWQDAPVLKLRAVAKTALVAADDDPAVTRRVAQAVERGSFTAANIASLRALLRDADRIDDVLVGGSPTRSRALSHGWRGRSWFEDRVARWQVRVCRPGGSADAPCHPDRRASQRCQVTQVTRVLLPSRPVRFSTGPCGAPVDSRERRRPTMRPLAWCCRLGRLREQARDQVGASARCRSAGEL
jgi:hypothetical protein